MRKYLIGAVAGAVLMFGIQAGASGVLTGSKVAGEKAVNFNGKSIGQAAIINNTSYLPVRAVANSLGLDINLDGRAINLSTPESVTAPSESADPVVNTVVYNNTTYYIHNDDESNRFADLINKLNVAQSTIGQYSSILPTWQKMVDGFEANNQTNDPQYKVMKDEVDDMKAKLSAALQTQSDIESQLKEFTKP